jgi:hypothetical protein
MGAGGALVPCIREMGRLELATPLEVVWNLFVESSIMACSDGDPLWVVPTNIVHDSLPLGERHKLPKQSVMNSRLPE